MPELRQHALCFFDRRGYIVGPVLWNRQESFEFSVERSEHQLLHGVQRFSPDLAQHVVVIIINDALFCLRDDPHAATRACWMYALARHILPWTEAFEAWFEACVQRLEGHFPREAAIEAEDLFEPFEGMGEAVPREAFDPSFGWEPEMSAMLLDGFLRQLRPDTNPYLRRVEELEGVEGLEKGVYRFG